MMSEKYKFICPPRHNEVVKNLLSGKFILHSDELYSILYSNLEYYRDFFQISYGYELLHTTEVIYLLSEATQEKFSRNIMLLLAVLSWEFNREGKNIYTELENRHTIKKIEDLVKKSSFKDSCRGINIEKLLKDAASRNLLLLLDNEKSVQFTSAVTIFLDAAKEIAELE